MIDHPMDPPDDDDTPEALGDQEGPERATTQRRDIIAYPELTGFQPRHADGPLPGKPLPVGPVGGAVANEAGTRNSSDAKETFRRDGRWDKLEVSEYHPARPEHPSYSNDHNHIAILHRAGKLGESYGGNERACRAFNRLIYVDHVVVEMHDPWNQEQSNERTDCARERIHVYGALDGESALFLRAVIAGADPAEVASDRYKMGGAQRRASGETELRTILRIVGNAQDEWDSIVHELWPEKERNLMVQKIADRVLRLQAK